MSAPLYNPLNPNRGTQPFLPSTNLNSNKPGVLIRREESTTYSQPGPVSIQQRQAGDGHLNGPTLPDPSIHYIDTFKNPPAYYSNDSESSHQFYDSNQVQPNRPQLVMRPQEPKKTYLEDSTGINFDFKDKISDSPITSTLYQNPQVSPYQQLPCARDTIATSTLVPAQTAYLQPRPNDKYSNVKQLTGLSTINSQHEEATLSMNDSKLRATDVKYNSRTNQSFSRDQIEYGDHSDKLNHLSDQNRELKELLISKENQINLLKNQSAKLEKELQNIMDPLSKSSQLKTVPVFNCRNIRRPFSSETKR